MSRGGRSTLFRGLLRLALLAHPRDRRVRDGDEIMATALDAMAGRPSLLARGLFAGRILLDVVRSGLRERIDAARSFQGALPWRDGWLDLKVALRSLGQARAFATSAVLILALGIGANTVMFSALRSTLLTTPPYPEPERLVLLELTDSSTARPGPTRAFPWSYPKFLLLAEEPSVPTVAAAAFAVRPLTLTGSGSAERLSAELVTPGYFDILGVAPVEGRAFTAEDNSSRSVPVTILGYGLWLDRFGADRTVVGKDVTLNGRSVTVVGIAPPDFDGLSGSARLWLTVTDGAALTAPFLIRNAQSHWLRVVAKAAEGVGIDEVDARMREVGRRVEAEYPASDPTVVRAGAAVRLTEAAVNPQARTALLVLAAASALLLLVACTNLAGLLVARAQTRSRDAAVRAALGAGPWRVARVYLLEASILAAAGCSLALAVADGGLTALESMWPERFSAGSWNVSAAAVDALGVDGGAVAFTTGTALIVTLLMGLVPALVTAGRGQASGLRETRSAGRRPGVLGARSLLVAAETALALVLVVGAGLLLRSLSELSRVDRGFSASSFVTFDYAVSREGSWGDDPRVFHDEFLERLNAHPTVQSAALTCVPPLAGHCMITGVREAGDRRFPEGSRPSIGVHFVSDGFFETLGADILQGRGFTRDDRADNRPVVVLSESAVGELFPDDPSPLGRAIAAGISLTPENGTGAEVIGVVEDILFDRPANGIMPELFVSHRQQEAGGTVVLRPRGSPDEVVSAARAILAELDSDVPLFRVRTLDELEAAAAGDTRILGNLLTGFALLALILACTGVWAIVSFSVSRRTREIGVRIALGADAGSVVRSVQKRGVAASLVGLIVGGGLAYGLSGLLRSTLYGVESADPVTFVLASLLLAGVSLLASWIPARRATRVDPVVALRTE